MGTFFSYCLVGCLSMIVWTPAVLGVLYACVLYFCICTYSAQLSMFHMEKCTRNRLIIIIVIITLPLSSSFFSCTSSAPPHVTAICPCAVMFQIHGHPPMPPLPSATLPFPSLSIIHSQLHFFCLTLRLHLFSSFTFFSNSTCSVPTITAISLYASL